MEVLVEPRTVGGSIGCSQDCGWEYWLFSGLCGGSSGCSKDYVVGVLDEPRTLGGSIG